MGITNRHILTTFALLLLFTSFQKAYSQFSASAASAGSVTTTSTTQGTDWTNPTNVQTLDNSFATCLITGTNKPTYYLDAKNWGFQSSNSSLGNYIPPGATINGIEVYITLRKSNLGKIKDNKIILLKAGSEAGSDKSRGVFWPTAASEVKFGNNVDLWGTTWTASDLTNSNFGIRISAKNNGSKDVQAEIDYIRISVYFNQSFYYSKSSGNLELTTTWGMNTDGSGTNPLNFSGNGQVFFLQNRTSASLTANFTITGVDSKMIIGNGSTATTLTIPSNYILNAKVDITAFSNLVIINTTNPILGSIADNTTVTYGASADQTVLAATYYNLTLSGTGTKSLQNSTPGFSSVNNILTIASGITFTNSGDNVFVYGSSIGLSNAGTATGNGKYSYSIVDVNTNISGTGTYSNLEIDCGTTSTTKTLTLSNATTITGTLYLTDGTFANGTNLTLLSGSAIQLSDGTLGSSIASASGYDVIYDVYSTSSPKTSANELTGNVRNFTIQTGNGFAINLNKNLVLSGNLTITSGTLDPTSSNYNITVAGNFTNNGTITSRNDITTFNGSSSQTISASASQTFYDLTINNSSGGVQFNTPASINHSLTLTNGIVTTSSTNLLTLASAATISGGSSSSYINGPMKHTLSATSGTKVFPIGKSGAYRPITLSLAQISSSTTYYTGEVFSGAPPSRTLPTGITSVSSVRYYTISCSDNSNLSSAAVTINYGADDNVTDPSNTRILKSSGTDWLNEGGEGIGTPTGNITSSLFNSFCDFVLGYGNFSTLPLEWVSFTASYKNSVTELKWETANEYNTSYFTVQRSGSGNDWRDIGTVNTNNQSMNFYSFTDHSPLPEKNLYRVILMDKDGKQSYSRVVTIDNLSFEKMVIANNPVTNSSVNIIINQPEILSKKEITIRVFDMNGTLVTSIKKAPVNIMSVPLNNFFSGQYILFLTADQIQQKAILFVQR